MNSWKRMVGVLAVLATLMAVRTAAAADITCPRGGSCKLPAKDLSDGTFSFTLGCAKGSTPLDLVYSPAQPPGAPAVSCVGTVVGLVTEYVCAVPQTLRAQTSGELSGKTTSCTGQAAPDEAAIRLIIEDDGNDNQKQNAEASPPLGFLPEATWKDVLTQLHLPIDRHQPGNYYNRTKDVAVLFFDAEGEPYYPMLDIIDEDDDIYVVIADKGTRVRSAKIAVQGCDRPAVEPRIYGKKVKGEGRSGVADKPEFVIRAVGKCAGNDTGGPQLTVTYENKPHVVTIPVNPLYRFAVGVALAFDQTRQREFTLRTLPGETVPRIAKTHDHIGLSSLVYVSFYPSARDFRKTNWLLWQRAQLFVGLDPRALDEHLVVGAGYELTMGLNLLVGWRAVTRQKVLSEGSGYAPGMKFDGSVSDLPTRERWESGGLFLGAGVDSTLLARLR